jgi:hypothetical protein
LRLLQLALISSALTLSACNEAPPPKQNPTAPAEFDAPPLSAQVEPEPVPEPSRPVADIGGECSIEYTWSHDIPRRGGAHHVGLRWVRAGDEPAHWQVEDSWTPHGSSKPQIIRRTITDEQALLAFEAGIAAIREFNFAKASSSAAADVPSVTLFVGSKEEATEIRLQDWYAAPPDLVSRVKAMLRELQAEAR